MWYALVINGMIVDVKWATRWPDPRDFEAFDARVVSPDATVLRWASVRFPFQMKREMEMTFEDKIKEMLFSHGLFEDQAVVIVEMMKADKANEPMLVRWQDSVEDYPQTVLVLLWHLARRTALEYIDTNCPQAWFRPMFE